MHTRGQIDQKYVDGLINRIKNINPTPIGNNNNVPSNSQGSIRLLPRMTRSFYHRHRDNTTALGNLNKRINEINTAKKTDSDVDAWTPFEKYNLILSEVNKTKGTVDPNKNSFLHSELTKLLQNELENQKEAYETQEASVQTPKLDQEVNKEKSIARPRNTIKIATASFAAAGAVSGAGLGVGIGLGLIPFTFGLSLPATPVLATILGGVGLIGGAIVGFTVSVIGSGINYLFKKKNTQAVTAGECEPLLRETRSNTRAIKDSLTSNPNQSQDVSHTVAPPQPEISAQRTPALSRPPTSTRKEEGLWSQFLSIFSPPSAEEYCPPMSAHDLMAKVRLENGRKEREEKRIAGLS